MPLAILFEAFEVKPIRELAGLDAAAQDHFVIEAPLEIWREMVENIHDNGGPDLEHTLNYLTFSDDPMRVSGPDQLQVDAFYRYNQSRQNFFNGVARVETSHDQQRWLEHGLKAYHVAAAPSDHPCGIEAPNSKYGAKYSG